MSALKRLPSLVPTLHLSVPLAKYRFPLSNPPPPYVHDNRSAQRRLVLPWCEPGTMDHLSDSGMVR